MRVALKYSLRNLVVDSHLWRLFRPSRAARDLENWQRAGKPFPPPHLVKQRIVSAYCSAFRPTAFIETGTLLGDMVYAMKDSVEAIYSIELSHELCKVAKRRFRAFPHVRIVEGDSGSVLSEVVKRVGSGRCLFWLDGHYSGGVTAKGAEDTPITRELRAIFDSECKDPVILVDDARAFTGVDGYPTLASLRSLIATEKPEYDFQVSNDVIRIHPKAPVSSEF